ncbi:hypothetical protein GRAN_3906 [Granulicella sibirica]|uniref:Uncharacterized protein n=2 Tax=Granulicella sibirica TaxID=2479048 RepID=A0A4Q0SWK8_9BACT|nr:hypothetical protein GRAN_3906 [Granulicella sibirica]
MLIYQPQKETGEWRDDALYREAQTALHALIVPDTEGALAAKFGAETSGEVMLYSPQDRQKRRGLLYAGGVTGARGMDGENAGVDALARAFANQRKETARPVFGCSFLSLLNRQATGVAEARLANPEAVPGGTQ